MTEQTQEEAAPELVAENQSAAEPQKVAAAEIASAPATRCGQRKERVGVVVSDRQDKTIVVEVARRTSHPLYRKIIKRNRKYTAHDVDNQAKRGDTVRIVETRPLSKRKRWRLVEIISRGE